MLVRCKRLPPKPIIRTHVRMHVAGVVTCRERWFPISITPQARINTAVTKLRLLLGLVLAGLLAEVGSEPALAKEPVVVITGGVDEAGQVYRWTVTNEHTVPISYLSIPHYGAVSVEMPDGWNGDLTVRGGEGGRPGKFIVKAEFPWAQISQSGSAEFSLSLPEPGRAWGFRNAHVRFEDGMEILVSLEVPLKETAGERSVPLIALGAIFAAYVIVQALRRRSRRAPSALFD